MKLVKSFKNGMKWKQLVKHRVPCVLVLRDLAIPLLIYKVVYEGFRGPAFTDGHMRTWFSILSTTSNTEG